MHTEQNIQKKYPLFRDISPDSRVSDFINYVPNLKVYLQTNGDET